MTLLFPKVHIVINSAAGQDVWVDGELGGSPLLPSPPCPSVGDHRPGLEELLPKNR